MNKSEFDALLNLVTDLENEALAHGERQIGAGTELCYARAALVSAIDKAREEYALLELSWGQQQHEIEALRLSLNTRTAQRDEAEFKISCALSAQERKL